MRLKDLPIPNRQIPGETQENRDRMYKFFGWTYEDVKDGVLPMAEKGEEAIASMGADIPLARCRTGIRRCRITSSSCSRR